jgi:uncharacterized protein YjbJ (UPF0337 family)
MVISSCISLANAQRRGWLRALPNLTVNGFHNQSPETRLNPWTLTPHRAHSGELKNAQMNWDRVEGNWNEFKGKIQQQWGKLTNDDLEQVKGKRTELCGRLQQKYGYAKDQAEREVDNWLKSTP